MPKVLVAGNVNEFRARIERNRPVNVIGYVIFVGKVGEQSFDIIKDQKILLNGSIVDQNELKNIPFDYIVFNDHLNYLRHAQYLLKKLLPEAQLVTMDFFIRNVDAGFYSYADEAALFRLLYQKKTRTLLDVDAFFAEGQQYVKPFQLSQLSIEGLRGSKDFAINDNFYDRIYDSSLDCRFKHYDVILLTAERDQRDLRAAVDYFRDMADEFIIYSRRFDEAKGVKSNWSIFQQKMSSDAAIYVIAHKKFSVDMPEGYIPIHAGRALGNDLGYIGDDTGDNISELNPYLNELTALYWLWKNAGQSIIGTSHYRRFFTLKSKTDFDAADILTTNQALELLKDYDMIIGNEAFSLNSQRGLLTFDAEFDSELAERAVDVIKKMLKRHQPDYVDSFEQIMSNQSLFGCNMMITRKYIFDAYCQWLFSFLLPAAKEFIPQLESVTVRRKRILGFIAERMFGVWLLKNRLRLRELPIMIDR